MEKSIKESMELLDGVLVLVQEYKKVMADGKVSFDDLPVLLGLMSKVATVTAAVEGADQVVEEAKDFSAEEINQIVGKVVEIVNAARA